MKKIVFIVEKTNTGYSAFAKNYPAYTVGTTMKELKKNMLDAINSWFEYKGKPVVSASQIEARMV